MCFQLQVQDALGPPKKPVLILTSGQPGWQKRLPMDPKAHRQRSAPVIVAAAGKAKRCAEFLLTTAHIIGMVNHGNRRRFCVRQWKSQAEDCVSVL